MRHRVYLSIAAFALTGASAFAQTGAIQIGELDAAQDYSAGILDAGSGGLDRNAWQGTSAKLATRLIEDLPQDISHPIAQAMVDAALLSGGVPPEGDATAMERYTSARNAYLLATGQGSQLSALAARDPALGRDARFQTDLALSDGNTDSACADSDGIIDGRSDAYWAKLRAFCHAIRKQVPAAELTAELLKKSGHDDPAFFELLTAINLERPADNIAVQTPLHTAMLKAVGTASTETGLPGQLNDVIARLATEDVNALLPAFSAIASANDLSPSYDVKSASTDSSPRGTAQLYVLTVDGRSPQAGSAFLSRMERAGQLRAAALHLSPLLQTFPMDALVEDDLSTFAKAAIVTNDIGLLMGLFQALPADSEDAIRLAVVTDALGGGFRLTPLGDDLEGPLLAGEQDAERDVVIAMALGARMSDDATMALESADLGTSKVGLSTLLALSASASDQSRAETALRSAMLLEGDPDTYSLGQTISALQASGLDRFARQVAAYDYADRL